MNAPITGYRALTDVEAALINQIKAKGAEIEALCDRVDRHIEGQYDNAFTSEVDTDDIDVANAELNRLDNTNTSGWAGEARINFQKALMFLTRAVAQPTSF